MVKKQASYTHVGPSTDTFTLEPQSVFLWGPIQNSVKCSLYNLLLLLFKLQMGFTPAAVVLQ
jgi:hypothetical protein